MTGAGDQVVAYVRGLIESGGLHTGSKFFSVELLKLLGPQFVKLGRIPRDQKSDSTARRADDTRTGSPVTVALSWPQRQEAIWVVNADIRRPSHPRTRRNQGSDRLSRTVRTAAREAMPR